MLTRESWDQEEVALTERSIRHDLFGMIAFAHDVLAHFHCFWHNRGPRRDAFDIDLQKLLDEGQNFVQLATHFFSLASLSARRAIRLMVAISIDIGSVRVDGFRRLCKILPI